MSPLPPSVPNGQPSMEIVRLANAVKAAVQDFEAMTEALEACARELEEKRVAQALALKTLNAARAALQKEAAK
jgi:hypothetical protein